MRPTTGKMKTYQIGEIPSGVSWIKDLDAPSAIQQCVLLGLNPASTLEENRVILRNFVSQQKQVTQGNSSAQIANSILTRPPLLDENSQENSSVGVSGDALSATPATDVSDSQMRLGVTTPLTVAASTCSLGSSTNPTYSNQVPISSHQPCQTPQWDFPAVPSVDHHYQRIISDTAAAVGSAIAQALSTSDHLLSRPSSGQHNSIMQDMLRRVPVTNGIDPKQVVHFLIQVSKIHKLGLTDDRTLILNLLSRTAGQLKDLWVKAIASEGSTIVGLQETILDHFLPHRLRHSILSDLLYRVQRNGEPLAEFVTELQDTSSLLMPALPDAELLEIALTGLNNATRSRMAGFPSPTRVEDLLTLAPRIEVVARLQSQNSDNSTQQIGSRPNRDSFHQYRQPFRYRPTYGYRQQPPAPRQFTNNQQRPTTITNGADSSNRQPYSSSGYRSNGPNARTFYSPGNRPPHQVNSRGGQR